MKLEFYNTAAQREAGSQAENMHLPKKSHTSFLKTLLLLALMLVGSVGVSWGQTSFGKAEINGAPTSATDWQVITESGNVKAWYKGTSSTEFTNGAKEINGKWYVKLSNDGFIKIRVAKGSVVAGDILRVETIDIYQNSDQQNLGFQVEGSGKTAAIKENDNAVHTLDYTLRASDIRVDSEDGAYDYIQINRNGNSGCGYHSVEILQNAHYTVAIDLTKYSEGPPSGCDAWFTIGDDPTKYREAKSVAVGTIVTYTMSSTNPHYTPVGWRTRNWQSHDTGWMVWGSSFTTTVRSAAAITEGELGCNGDNHVWSDHEKLNFGNINAAPEFSSYKEGYVVNFGVVDQHNNAASDRGTVTATVNGNPITSGSLVANNTKVTFTVTANDTKYLSWGWYENGTRKYEAATVERTVTADLTMNAVLNQGVTFNAYPNNGSLGDVRVWLNDTEKGTTFTTNPGTTTITFRATPKANATFVGWYPNSSYNDAERVSTDAKYTVPNTNNGLDLFGKFVDNTPALKTIPKPYCNHAPDKANGDNYFDIRQLNPAEDVTLGEWSSETGRTVTVPTNGGYMSYAFEQEYNLGDLVKWTISDNSDLRARVNNVEFIDANGNILSDCWTNAGDRQNVGLDVQSKLKKVKEIRIHFKGSNEEHLYNDAISYTFKWICFSFEHSGRTLPTLIDGTATEMEIYETTSLSITNTPGFWRQFTDGNYDTIKKNTEGGLIDETKEWKSSYKFDNMQVGNYYFGARDGGNCNLGYYHETELVKVHVNVKALDIIDDISLKSGSSEEKSFDYDSANDIVNLYYKKTIDDPNVSSEKDPEVSLTVKSTWNSRDNDADCTGVKFSKDKGTELMVEAPNGYRVQKVDITFGHNTKYNVSMNRGNKILEGEGSSISYTNLSEYDYVRMVVRDEASEEQKEVHVTNVKVYLVPVNAKIIDESRDITVEGVDRKYWLYVPENVKNGNNKNVAVVFALHGGGEDYEPTHNGQLNFNSLADANNFIVVYPRAAEHYFYHFNGEKARAWEATGAANNDTKLFEAIIEALKTNTDGFSIDEKKVYMAGFSVGGMMAYATANVLSKKFAAFASIAGLPMNEVHHRTHSDRPVPFLHVHGTKDDFVRYDHMPTIVDNMLTRNGLSYTPTATVEGEADIWGGNGKTRYKKFAYGNEEASAENKTATPYIYYQIGTGMTASDTGMGHNHWCNIGGKDVKQVMWEFFKGRSLQAASNDIPEFKAQISLSKTGNEGNRLARDHGWNVPTQGSSYGGTRLVAQYGESGGYSVTDENVYHTIQLPEGQHYLKLHASGGSSQSFINIRIVRLGDVSEYFNKLPAELYPGQEGLRDVTFTVSDETVLDVNYDTEYSDATKDMVIPFSTTGIGEYRIIITKSGLDDAISIENIEISRTGDANGHPHEGELSTDFDGFFSYNNRLCAQWNFDLTDPFRFNAELVKKSIIDNTGYWSANYDNTNTGNASATNGTIIYTYEHTLGTPGDDTNTLTYEQLSYDGSKTVPVTAGLMFKTDEPGHVRIQVSINNGKLTGSQLVVDEHVKMYIPYVENSYRPDNGSDEQVENYNTKKGNYDAYKNCMHHIKRDIIYMSLANGTVWDEWKGDHWDHGHVINKCIDRPDQMMFHTGGEEYVNDKKYYKMNYLGTQGMPCVMQFRDRTTIDRIGVNRNLTYSFYSEYINELGYSVPQPRTRIVGNPKGLKVASIGDTNADYVGAIAMTYGGWPDDREGYDKYIPFNGGSSVADEWQELGVYNGNEQFYTWATMPEPTATSDVPIATDGFPVFSRIDQPAKSETLMPNNSKMVYDFVNPNTKQSEKVASYHPANDGNFLAGTNDKNITPWSLPCRGAYLKFEPSRPGVLNVHILQRAGASYYIVDEFGQPLEDKVFFKTAQSGTSGISCLENGRFALVDDHSDYAKYSFNVYPGKTYYMFSNEAGLGMTGFYYEPDVYRYNSEENVPAGKSWELARYDVGMDVVNLTPNGDGDAYSFPSGLTKTVMLKSPTTETTIDDCGSNYVEYPIEYNNKAVTVQITRHFNANAWNTICLPFSMNQVEMENVFGKGTRVVLLRDVQPNYRMPNNLTTLNYIYHENQDIMADYPYFICPTKTIDKIEAHVYLKDAPSSIVAISSQGPLTIPSFEVNGTTYSNYDGYSDWTFTGTFTGEEIPNGSFVISGGNLCKLENANGKAKMNPYRAYMKLNNPSGAKAAPVIDFFATGLDFIEGEEPNLPTQIDIEQTLQNQGIFTQGVDVYTVDGKKIRSNAINLQNLPKGIYVVNKKKYVVK